MPGWINGGNYIGVDLNPGGLSVILKNYTDAINERFDLLASGETKPQYHTVNGDIESPALVDFAGTGNDDGMDFDEIPQTLDDIEAGIDSLLGFVDFMDPDDLDTQYTTFAEVALDATGSETRPSVNTTDKALWNFYKDTLNKLIVVRDQNNVPDQWESNQHIDSGVDNDDAWDNMRASDPFLSRPNTGFSLRSIHNPITAYFVWSVYDNGLWNYPAFDFPAGGSIVKDRFFIPTKGRDDAPGHDSGTVARNFALSWDDPGGPSRILEITKDTDGTTYEGSAPSLFGLLRAGGTFEGSIEFGGLPADPPWTRPVNSTGTQELTVLWLHGTVNQVPLLATMWIDYTSELDFA